jgi:hypothetical protein
MTVVSCQRGRCFVLSRSVYVALLQLRSILVAMNTSAISEARSHDASVALVADIVGRELRLDARLDEVQRIEH